MRAPYRIIGLISGRGSNLLNLINKASDYEVCAIISNKQDAPGLKYGAQFNIPTHIFARAQFDTINSLKAAILDKCKQLNPDLIVLAGYMLIVSPEFVDAFYGRIINIHPALLPKFPGLDTHRRALEAGEKQHGCTVHFVDKGVDTGPAIAQAMVPCLPNDTEESLAARVLAREHEIYPWVVKNLALGKIKFNDRSIYYDPEVIAESRTLDFILHDEM